MPPKIVSKMIYNCSTLMVADTAEWVACEQTSGAYLFFSMLTFRQLHREDVEQPPGGRSCPASRDSTTSLGTATPAHQSLHGAFSHLLGPFGLRVTREDWS